MSSSKFSSSHEPNFAIKLSSKQILDCCWQARCPKMNKETNWLGLTLRHLLINLSIEGQMRAIPFSFQGCPRSNFFWHKIFKLRNCAYAMYGSGRVLCFKFLTKSIGKRAENAPSRTATSHCWPLPALSARIRVRIRFPADAGKNLLCVKMCWLQLKSSHSTSSLSLSVSRSRFRSLGMSYGCQVGFISVSFAHCLVKLSCVALYVLFARFCLILQSDFRIFAEHNSTRLDSTRVEQSPDLWPPLMYVYPFSLTLHFSEKKKN